MRYVKSFTLAIIAFFSTPLVASTDIDNLLFRGQYEQALLLIGDLDTPSHRLQAAAAYLGLGQPQKSLDLIGEDPAGDFAVERADIVSRALMALGNDPEAKRILQATLESVGEDSAAAASIHNNLGVLSAVEGEAEAASTRFRRAITQATNPRTRLDAAINLARLSGEAPDNLDELLAAVQGETRYAASRTLAVAQLLRLFGHPVEKTLALLESSVDSARSTGMPGLEARALDEKSQLYAGAGRHEEALALAREAVFIAQSAGLDKQVWRHQLQVARLQQETDKAAAAETYRNALNSLSAAKDEIPETGHRSYRNLVSPVFYEYAELMLAMTRALSDQKQRNANLRLIRDTLEEVKTAEIQEYYQDECVVADALDKSDANIPETAAVIYPILLPRRIEVLVSVGEDMFHFPTSLTTGELELVVNDYRLEIEEYGAEDDYLPLAQVLYDQLIAPAESFIESRNVDTIVFVPDGPLRTVPVSTFHNGDMFLVEKYAIATSPGLSLTSTETSRDRGTKLLAQGLTESVRGFAALPNVDNELRAIRDMYPAQVYQDDGFVLESTERELSTGDYNVVHIATHGEFDADHSKSYLLAYDDLLSMDRLQGIITNRKYNETPLDLLVLSACKTAAGDDKAALGLAGVALRSGAKSALATLWYISDAATAQVITRFYEELKDPGVTKADALRRAQMVLIENPALNHPTDGAPFLLVGNWL